MPVTPTYPGVYVQEIPSGSRTITGVSTSVTAFVGYFKEGAMNEPVRVLSFADFEREFGGLDRESEASYAVKQFFQNGGTEALVIRTADGASKAGTVLMDDYEGGRDVLTVEAANEGRWGHNLRLDVDYETAKPAETFNLTVSKYDNLENPPAQVETFRNLSMDENSSRFVEGVINEGSSLIRVTAEEEVDDDTSPGDIRPFNKMGTWGSEDVMSLADGDALSDPLDSDELDPNATYEIDVTVTTQAGQDSNTLSFAEPPAKYNSLGDLIASLQKKLRNVAEALEDVNVEVTEDGRLHVHAPPGEASTVITFSDAQEDLAAKLGLDAPEVANVQQYSVGVPEGESYGAEKGGQKGENGDLPGTKQLTGDRDDKTGIYALEDADIFNILCIPRTAKMDDANAMPVLTEAIDYCAEQRAFMIVDIPSEVDEVEEVEDWVDGNTGVLRGDQADHAALYFPRLNVPDPLNEFRSRTIGASGTLAGLYARIDTDRGVWKAPAGTEATLRGVRSLDYKLSDAENGVLNPLGINALRTFDVRGTVSWGARTLRGADRLADEYKYIPVRRLALFIEESLFRGLKWVVFEPNDEPLWAQIRTNVNEFMQRLFRQGAFQGTSPGEAYFVKCDSETTTQGDIDRGIVNIVVGFAPLKPAEFVILKIQQKAGQEA